MLRGRGCGGDTIWLNRDEADRALRGEAVFATLVITAAKLKHNIINLHCNLHIAFFAKRDVSEKAQPSTTKSARKQWENLCAVRKFVCNSNYHNTIMTIVRLITDSYLHKTIKHKILKSTYLELHRFCCLQLVTADDVIAQLFLEAVMMVGGTLIASQRRCLRRDDGALV